MLTQPLNFGTKVEEKSNDLIPRDTLLAMAVNVRGVKNSKTTQGEYVDIELTVAPGQPYAGRKIWMNIINPFDNRNSQEGRDMGMMSIRRILEAVNGARPDNAASYILNAWADLSSKVVPVMVGVQKAKANSGYEDKNNVEFLSPHSSIKKVVECYNLLRTGVFKYEKESAKPAATQTGFGAAPAAQSGFTPPAAAPQAAPGFLAPQPAQAPQQQYQQPSPQQAFTPPAQTQQPSTATVAAGGYQGQGNATPAPQEQGVPFAAPQPFQAAQPTSASQPAAPAQGYPSNGVPPAQFPGA